MNIFTVVVDIEAKRLKSYYAKPLLKLKVQSLCGHTLSIPLSNFQRFFSHSGLNGRFRISADHAGKIVNIEKLS